MFWGLIMQPQKRYTQKVKKAFHISMASLDISSTPEKGTAQIMIGFEGKNYLLCTLRNPDIIQCPLDLNFEEGDQLQLAVNGKCNVHLTGYLIDENDGFSDEDDLEEFVKKHNKRKGVDSNSSPAKKSKKETVQNDADDTSDSDDEDFNIDETQVSEADDEVGEEEEDDDEDDNEEEDEDNEDDSGDDGEELEQDEDSSLSEEEEDEEKSVKPKINGAPKPVTKQAKKEEKQSKENLVKKPVQQTGGLIIEDLKEGQGAAAKPGKFISVYYEGRLKSNNKVFDSTRQGKGFTFKLGAGEVIKGWDRGLVGMKVGGKRKITCPPNMAYGAKGSPPAIPANSTLVFTVELKKIS